MTITYSRADVALMVKVALFFKPSFLDGARVSRTQQRLMACGRMKLTPAVLSRLNLTPAPGGYQWNQ